MGIQEFDRGAVFQIVSDLELAPPNRTLVQHWLSLWSGNALPSRDALTPSALKPLLRNLIMFDVIPDKGVTVRLAGTTFNFVLGMELTGRDWIALAPPEYRAERLRIFSDIAVGAIGRGIRSIEMKSGKARTSEELILPFRADAGSDTRLVICHFDWKSGGDLGEIASREQALGTPLAFETIPLPLAKAASTRGL